MWKRKWRRARPRVFRWRGEGGEVVVGRREGGQGMASATGYHRMGKEVGLRSGLGMVKEERRRRQRRLTGVTPEARWAIEHVVISTREAVQLLPRSPQILSAQIKLIESYKLKWEKICQEPNISLRILPDHLETRKESLAEEAMSTIDHLSSTDDVNILENAIKRLPFLPD
ncbi:hypothetical protein KSP40_PGU021737 [Platanthera guangdongensis]|uniref:Uncharacterized protein n=1 Tax=Platanthera guangdongensis TaxID=2320717 RepID=A0ABR2N1W1_9ASPA